MSLLKPLQKVTGCKPKANEERQAYLTRLVTAVSEMQEDDWATLPDDAQDWVNDAITAIKAKKPVSDPVEEAEEAPAAEPAKKPKPAKVEAEEPEKATEAEEEAEEKPAPKAKPKAKAEVEKDETAAEAKPAKKAAKSSEPGAADKFRLAYIKALCSGKEPKPYELSEKLDLGLSKDYASSMAWEIRKTLSLVRKAGFLKEE